MEKDSNGNWTEHDSWKETCEMLGILLFMALVLWAYHMKWVAERTMANERHSPMLLCQEGC